MNCGSTNPQGTKCCGECGNQLEDAAGLDLALTELDAVFIPGSGDSELLDAAAEAAAIFGELRATPFLARLEAAVAGTLTAPSEDRGSSRPRSAEIQSEVAS